MEFQIESGITMKITGRGRPPGAARFPLADMDVGHSFLIPCDVENKKEVDSWRRKLLAEKKRMDGGKWQTALTSEGLRVWRTE
jgi:hypothetical protein